MKLLPSRRHGARLVLRPTEPTPGQPVGPGQRRPIPDLEFVQAPKGFLTARAVFSPVSCQA